MDGLVEPISSPGKPAFLVDCLALITSVRAIELSGGFAGSTG